MANKSNTTQLEAIVSFDERGQLVIPKDLRKKFNLKAGDKFALISCMTKNCEPGCCDPDCCDPGGDSTLCCFTLVHTDQLKDIVNQALSPMMTEVLGATQ